MSEESLKANTVALIRLARTLERESIAALSPAQRDQVGTLAQWSARDKLFHVNVWKAVEARRLAAARAGEADKAEDYPTFNDAMFERYKDESWAAAARFADDATNALIAEIEALSEADLVQPGLYEWLGPRTPSEFALSGCVWHALMHMSEAYIERGDGDGALALIERTLPALRAVMQSDREKGTAQYNLACIYAQMGKSERALDLLGDALALRPDLAPYAPEDSDLKSLWDMEAFRALTAERQ